jgi:putative ABC transport system permease protein
MLGHYVKIAVRNLWRYKGHSLINVLGLAMGIACCLLILLFLRDEVGYDRFHDRPDRVFRITQDVSFPGQPELHAALTPIVMTPVLAREIPEMAAVARLVPYFEGALPGKAAVSYRNQHQFYEPFFWTDASLFRVFTLPLVAGDAATALAKPNTAVLAESTARKYFGDEPAVGKVLRIDSGFSDEDYTVTGVMRDLPYNSHVHFEVLLSLATLEHVKDPRVVLDQWWLADAYTYVRLAGGAPAAKVEAKLPAFVRRHFPAMGDAKAALHLQPVTDIHLRSHLRHELEVNGDVGYVYIFSAIALLTLLIACANFMNLSTARYAHRAREVAMRKVVGARRAQLVAQFLGESLALSLLATALAVALVRLVLPAFNAFSGKRIALPFDPAAGLVLLGVAVAVGVVAGSYPAFFLSSFAPATVLKSAPPGGTGSGRLRKVLIVLQFAVSVGLLIATAVIYDQLRYMRAQDLGFDMKDVVVLPIRDVELRDRFLPLKDAMAHVPNVLATTFTSLVVGREPPQIGVQVEGVKEFGSIGTLVIDYDFPRLFKVPLVAGRSLARDEKDDLAHGFLVNEAAVAHWGFRSPREAVGKRLAWGGWKVGRIVGVVRNFHQQALQHEIDPLLLHVRPLTFHYMYVRIAPRQRAATLEGIERTWRRLLPSKPFEYFFLDDEFDHAYRADQRLARLVGLFALVAIFVACLGLFGLAAFTAERRTREIGIRKVLGSSVGAVVRLLSREFTGLVLLANVLAWPAAYFLMKHWLQDFAYRTPIHPLDFVLGGLVALVIAWLTVSYQALRAALVDPARALRDE